LEASAPVVCLLTIILIYLTFLLRAAGAQDRKAARTNDRPQESSAGLTMQYAKQIRQKGIETAQGFVNAIPDLCGRLAPGARI
jgi:uncharacterized MAPEG superfamily protein